MRRATGLLLTVLVLAGLLTPLLALPSRPGPAPLIPPGSRLLGVSVERDAVAERNAGKTLYNIGWNIATGTGFPGKVVLTVTANATQRFEPVYVNGSFLNIYGDWVNTSVGAISVENLGLNYNYSRSLGSRELDRILYWADPWNSWARLDIYMYHVFHRINTAGTWFERWSSRYIGTYYSGGRLLLFPSVYRLSEIGTALKRLYALARGSNNTWLSDVFYTAYNPYITDVEMDKIVAMLVNSSLIKLRLYSLLRGRIEGLESPGQLRLVLMDRPAVIIRALDPLNGWSGNSTVVLGHIASLMVLVNLTRYYGSRGYNTSRYEFYKIVYADVYVEDRLEVRATLRYDGLVGLVYRNGTVSYVPVDGELTVYSDKAYITGAYLPAPYGYIPEKLVVPLPALELNSRIWDMVAGKHDMTGVVAVYLEEAGLRLEKISVGAELVIKPYLLVAPRPAGDAYPVVDALVVDRMFENPVSVFWVDYDYANKTWFNAWIDGASSLRDPSVALESRVDWGSARIPLGYTVYVRDINALPYARLDLGYTVRIPLYGYDDAVRKIYVVDYAVVRPATYMYTVPVTSRASGLRGLVGDVNERGEWYGYIAGWGIPAWEQLPNGSKVYAYTYIRISDAPLESAPLMMYSIVNFTRFSDLITEGLYTIMRRHYYSTASDYLYAYGLGYVSGYEETLMFYPHERVLRFVTLKEDAPWVMDVFENLTGEQPYLVQGLPIRGLLVAPVSYRLYNKTSRATLGVYGAEVLVPLEMCLFRINTTSGHDYFMVFVRIRGADMERIVGMVRNNIVYGFLSGNTWIEYDRRHDMIVMAVRVYGYRWSDPADYGRVYVDSVEEKWFPGTRFWTYDPYRLMYRPTFIIDKGHPVYVLWHYRMVRIPGTTDVELDIERSFAEYLYPFSLLWWSTVRYAFEVLTSVKARFSEMKNNLVEAFNNTARVFNELGYRAELLGNGAIRIRTRFGDVMLRLVGSNKTWALVASVWNNTLETLGVKDIGAQLVRIKDYNIYMIPFLLYLPLYPLYNNSYDRFVDLLVSEFKYAYPKLYAERVAWFLLSGALVTVPRKCYIVPVAIGGENITARVRVYDPSLNMTVLDGPVVYQRWRGMDAVYRAYVSTMLEYKVLEVSVESGSGSFSYFLTPGMSYNAYVYPLVYVPRGVVIEPGTKYWADMVVGNASVVVRSRYGVFADIGVEMNMTLVGRQFIEARLELEDGTVLAREPSMARYAYTELTAYALRRTVSWGMAPRIIYGAQGIEAFNFTLVPNATVLTSPARADQRLVLVLVYPGGGVLKYVLPVKYSDLFPVINFVKKESGSIGLRLTPDIVVGIIIATAFVYIITGGGRRRAG